MSGGPRTPATCTTSGSRGLPCSRLKVVHLSSQKTDWTTDVIRNKFTNSAAATCTTSGSRGPPWSRRKVRRKGLHLSALATYRELLISKTWCNRSKASGLQATCTRFASTPLQLIPLRIASGRRCESFDDNVIIRMCRRKRCAAARKAQAVGAGTTGRRGAAEKASATSAARAARAAAADAGGPQAGGLPALLVGPLQARVELKTP